MGGVCSLGAPSKEERRREPPAWRGGRETEERSALVQKREGWVPGPSCPFAGGQRGGFEEPALDLESGTGLWTARTSLLAWKEAKGMWRTGAPSWEPTAGTRTRTLSLIGCQRVSQTIALWGPDNGNAHRAEHPFCVRCVF